MSCDQKQITETNTIEVDQCTITQEIRRLATENSKIIDLFLLEVSEGPIISL